MREEERLDAVAAGEAESPCDYRPVGAAKNRYPRLYQSKKQVIKSIR